MAENSKLTTSEISDKNLSFEDFREDVLNDYRICCVSRECSLIGRKEVLTGKAKFGIFGDGKEVPQVVMAKAFRNGDFRSGYYRDQTFAFAAGILTPEEFFAQLYANPDVNLEPSSAGRQMNAHFASRSLNADGSWKSLKDMKNSSADGSPTSSQMPRSLGLALASKLYRQSGELRNNSFSDNGNEVCFVTTGDASTAEGNFWETVNAAGVLQVPLAISIWDDGYGISVPQKYQLAKQNLSELLKGFKTNEAGDGYDIYVIDGWDYAAIVDAYERGVAKTRKTHMPAIFHVKELTQPQGHSTSGSHERYKSKERLEWEQEFDCNKKFRTWIVENAIATIDELYTIETEAKQSATDARKSAWDNFINPIKNESRQVIHLLSEVAEYSSDSDFVIQQKNNLLAIKEPIRREVMITVKSVLFKLKDESFSAKQKLVDWKDEYEKINQDYFNSYLHTGTALKVPEIKPHYRDDSPILNGFEILNHCFDALISRDPRVFAFGEDVGKIGDVNQGFAGLQQKHGELRVFDTGIREATIIGQGIGMALRGLRPIAEIQYLDYLIFGIEPISDDLACLLYRTKGGQKAPLIIRTRGHRLEGIWHTGSPLGMLINAIRGIYLCVPRNMTQAAGFYNLLMKADEPAIVIECLNGYRLKEKLPQNISEFTIPLGVPEILREGEDVTIVTYGSCCRIASEAIEKLSEAGISCELIDVQTLLPFDINHIIAESLKKTNRILFLDEDVPGGASAYMYQQVIEVQNGYRYLDTKPVTLTAKAHRAAYASDGDYFSKPNAEDVFEAVYNLMHDAEPGYFGKLY
jgi:2-oxoisovalerate dehydrogenase E1 component